MSKRSQTNLSSALEKRRRLTHLEEENHRLRATNREAFVYLRSKVDELLSVIGTQTLKPEELDDQSLIEFDPIGIVARTFRHVLNNVRETNQKLSFAHDEIQAVFDTVGAAILVLDLHGKVVSFNQKTKDLLLENNDEITGKHCSDCICGNRTPDSLCMFKRVSKYGREQHIHNWSLDGRSFDVVGRPMFDDKGEVCHIVICYTDVSARRNAEAAMSQALLDTQEANAKLNGILRSVADSVLVTDALGHIVMMNQSAEELFDLRLREAPPMPDIGILPHHGFADFVKRAANQEADFLVKDFVFSEAADRERICQARLTVISHRQAGFQGCITILHDVTEQREIDRLKSEFVSTAAHELRTPLATIIGYTDLLLMKEDWSLSEQRDYLTLIQKKADRLGDIVSDLLDISRIESGEGVRLELSPCRLDLLCEEALQGFRHHAGKHLFVNEVSAPTVILADRFAVLQILENLLSNAVKYSPKGGVVRLSAAEVDGLCQCSVTDQGIGMSAAQLARVFDKFYRADATDTAVSGTGLGMTIVKHLLDAQGGRISLKSALGEGMTASFSLPFGAE